MNDEYDIVLVLWEDHLSRDRYPIPLDPDELVERPTISVGILVRESPKAYVIASDLERYEDRDDATYTVILKSTVVGLEKYGKVQLSDLRMR